MEYKADIASESAAAVADGLTSFMDMPTPARRRWTRALEDKYRHAAGRLARELRFLHGRLERQPRRDPRAIDPRAPRRGEGVSWGASTGNLLVDDPQVLDGIFRDRR